MSSEIKVDTISENTSAGGVVIDSVTLKDGGVTGTAAIVAGGGNGPTLGFQLKDTSGNAQPRLTNDANNDTVIRPGASGRAIMLANYANNATAINVDDSGHVTMGLQPCFRIGSGTQANIAVSTNVTAIFDSEVFDIGSNFASNTFTAPVTGKYYLGLLMRLNAVDSAASYIQIVIVGSNRNTTVFTFHNATELSADADNLTVSGSTVLDMDANDTAYVRIRIQSGTAQTDVDSDGSYFTGYLIG
jgi:hypothetical protein